MELSNVVLAIFVNYILSMAERKENGVPLVFSLLPCKSEMCYQKMWKCIADYCTERNVVLSPRIIHIDFEKALHNAVLSTFSNTSIMCCRFHLGNNFWKKIQSLGLSPMYKDKSSDIGKWLSKFFGLPFLSHDEVKNSLQHIFGRCWLNYMIALHTMIEENYMNG